MRWLKPLERAAKLALATLAAVLLWRPGRRARAARLVAAPKKVLLVRIDDRVGEALLTTPLFAALKALPSPPEVHALVHARAVRVLEGHPQLDRVIALDRRRLALGALAPGVAALRRGGYDVVVNCASWAEASVTAALVARLAGPAAAVVGPRVFPSSWLSDLPVPARADTRSEAAQRLHLLAPLGAAEQTPARPTFRAPRQTERARSFAQGLGGDFALVNPGGRLGWRRVPPACFAAGCRALSRAGLLPVVAWGPGEEALAAEVVRAAPGSVAAPPTDLDELAWLACRARAVVTNNTGPMHLAVAVGAPTLALFLHMDAPRWGHAWPPHQVVDLTPFADRAEAMEAEVVRAVAALAASLAPR